MTAEMVLRIGMAAGNLYRRGSDRHRVVIGKDTRLSGYMIENALTSGLLAAGMDVFLFGPVPTPAVSMLTRSMRADLGIMISASHNPYADNGIKIFGPDGFKLSDGQEETIEARGGGFTIIVPKFGHWFFSSNETDMIVGGPFGSWGYEGDPPWVILTRVEAAWTLSASDRQIFLDGADDDGAVVAAERDCRQQPAVAVAWGDLTGALSVLECPDGPSEVGVMYLYLPGTPLTVFVYYGIYNEEDRFYLETALGSLVLAEDD